MESAVQFEEQNLAEFFQNSVNLLKCGISAEKLASIERISTEQVQLYLYKLSILGLVAPARRDNLWAQLDTVLQSKSTPLKLSEEQRLAGAAAESAPSANTWVPNRPSGDKETTNKQRVVANLLQRSAEEAAAKSPSLKPNP